MQDLTPFAALIPFAACTICCRAAYENKKREILASDNLDQDDYGKAKSPFVEKVLNQMNDDE